MLFMKLYLLTLTTFSLIFISDGFLDKNITMAQSKTSSIYVKVKKKMISVCHLRISPK